MGISSSLFLLALGAILTFAVEATVAGIDINTLGVILMLVGGVGLLISLLWLTVLQDRRRGTEPVVKHDRREARGDLGQEDAGLR